MGGAIAIKLAEHRPPDKVAPREPAAAATRKTLQAVRFPREIV